MHKQLIWDVFSERIKRKEHFNNTKIRLDNAIPVLSAALFEKTQLQETLAGAEIKNSSQRAEKESLQKMDKDLLETTVTCRKKESRN